MRPADRYLKPTADASKSPNLGMNPTALRAAGYAGR